jgi:crotonobetainyl-CoA:carnitine CoA-transferase CaiB-like acyl-CoA transferase
VASESTQLTVPLSIDFYYNAAEVISSTSGPLAGVRVLDLTTTVSGPTATLILAGLGADVLKVERPGAGDDCREMPPHDGTWGSYFVAVNRGKRSLVLDLSRTEGVDVLLRIARTCDVFVENFRGGKADAMGLGEEALRAARPDIIYASLSAFGPRGPEFAKPGYDALLQARTGILSVTGSEDGAMVRTGVSVLDMGSGVWLALGILGALLERTRSGRGQRVDASLYQTGVMWMGYHLVGRQFTGRDPKPQGTRIGAFAPYGDFATLDGPIFLGISNDRLFARLCEAVERPDWRPIRDLSPIVAVWKIELKWIANWKRYCARGRPPCGSKSWTASASRRVPSKPPARCSPIHS